MEQISKIKPILIILFVFAAIMSYSQTIIVFNDDAEPNDPKHLDNPFKHGHRMPPAPIIGYIDWTTNTLDVSHINEEIITYEIWLDNACIMSTADQKIIVEYLSALEESSVSVYLHTEYHTYIGLYNPQY